MRDDLLVPIIQASRQCITYHLRTYGEDDLVPQLLSCSTEQLATIQRRAGDYAFSGPLGKSGMMYAKALALAAVEILEGTPRDLKRKRRMRVSR